MRKKDNVSVQAQLTELDKAEATSSDSDSLRVSSSSPTRCRIVKRDEPSKKFHNQSEKSRRNLMKNDFDNLRAMVPMDDDVQKQTTLSLLYKAKLLIRSLEAKDRKHTEFKAILVKEQQYLKRRLEQLQHLSSGGAIGFGNTLLLSAVAPTIQLENSISISSAGLNVPHILKRKQILLTSRATSEPQMVISDIRSSNILSPDNMCLMIDEMEYMEGLPYFGGPPMQEYLSEAEVEADPEEVEEIETETIQCEYIMSTSS